MRIVLANNRYFMVGGTTRYLFNVERLLQDRGHDVIPFSNRYHRTVETPWSRYFVDPPGGPDAPFFRDAPVGPRRAWSLFRRSVYDFEVKRALRRLVREQNMDLVYSVNICNFLGPSVIDAAHEAGVPYVLRLSDFNLICPAYLHLRDGSVCEECRGGLVHAIRHRCLQDSVKVSLARVLAMWIQRALRVYHRADRIVTPSAFLRTKLIEAGFDGEKIHHVPSFVDLTTFSPSMDWSGNEIVFAGRLAPEKGPETLIEAAALLPTHCDARVVFLGEGATTYVDSLRKLAGELAPGRVEFLGFLEGEALRQRIGRSLAVALPARWFENMPNSLTEAMALARPVLTTPLGSLPEQVQNGVTGRTLPVGDARSWADAILELWEDRRVAEEMGRAGRKRAERIYRDDLHYERLISVFRAAGVGEAAKIGNGAKPRGADPV